ncbi:MULTISPECIES: DUF1810 domain-containing protein [Sphingobium]|jgi:uncharacterized protein (DUF1810 family)|uniref:DUF1810 domain-containing protein n=1 Tax=Sphingobium limneticum TaxID=1007511 RepID=A0A5J5HTN3_9SPHN|nr:MULTISPECIES: DUF1810 domain-containing protein [Sphingobium]KAA9010879.1 DUF1810 domain-containing protein [Sphingobium limneticum]KAA9011498.1 DUF1810 domain-containing protein [Sphingobium limneticum]KAA9023747.1 DUF1810 domain-containing protein [Sphingobium limneticum]BBD03414.1 hypothetical protein YGS_C2P1428 [Sphingobium sp. YG1]
MASADLVRFLEAQAGVYEIALAEIAGGAKRSHWMWFIFPQLRGLGNSAIARHYGIASLAEARCYLDHAVLGARYLTCVEALQRLEGDDPIAVFGSIDAMKLRSSLTLFEIARSLPLFDEAIERWFDGERDDATRQRIG